MGIRVISTSANTSSGNTTPQPPEPDPKQFEILDIEEVNGWSIARVHYPACTTYNGNKVMVFACDPDRVRKESILDPHFLEREDRLSPVARFEYTKRGLKLARRLCAWNG